MAAASGTLTAAATPGGVSTKSDCATAMTVTGPLVFNKFVDKKFVESGALVEAWLAIPGAAGGLVPGAAGGEGVGDVSYADLTQLQALAERRRHERAHRVEPVDAAVTPVVAIAREALHAVGGIDPAFGPTRRGIADFEAYAVRPAKEFDDLIFGQRL